MTHDQTIALMAATIYAQLISEIPDDLSLERAGRLRSRAITAAQKIWRDVRDRNVCE